MNSSSTNNEEEEEEDNPASIWSTSSPIPSTANTTDIWASIPSTSSSTTSGYHPAYLSNPPTNPPPSSESCRAIDEFDPFHPTPTSSSTQPATLLGTGVRKNSKLVLIDTDSEEEGEGDARNGESESELELRKRLEREALELHERDKQERRRQQQQSQEGGGGGGGFGFVGNMFKNTFSNSTANSPTSSRPSTPSSSSPLPRVSSRPPPQQQSEETSTGSPLGKPFASIASVFRSNPNSSQSPQQPNTGSSNSLISAIAGKGKEKQQQPELLVSEEKPQITPPRKKKLKKKRRTRIRRPDPVFDFTKFLEQMRSRQADPIAKYLRSFLKEFSRKPPQSTVDQTRVVNDFLDFIRDKMRGTDPWKSIYQDEVRRSEQEEVEEEEEEEELEGEEEGEAENEKDEGEGEREEGEKELRGIERAEFEFELSIEAMEKLVMNRLWHLTFTPALDPNNFEGGMSPSGDLERDQVVRQRIRLFSWLEPKHLDLPISVSNEREGDSPTGSGSTSSDEGEESNRREENETTPDQTESLQPQKDEEKKKRRRKKGSEKGFIDFAASELRKMNQYKAPRDKLICVLNCCKVIFGLIRHVSSSLEDQGADTFIPFLIYVVLQANPDHLVSNLQYIQRFRNPEKLAGEGGYYLSSLNAAISFIETLDASALSNIDQSEFETNVANAVKLLASEEPPPPPPPRSQPINNPPPLPSNPSNNHDENSSASLITPQVQSQQTGEQEDPNSDRRKNLLLRSSDSVERAMSKPIGALAKIFEQIENLTITNNNNNEFTGQAQAQGQGFTPDPHHHHRRRSQLSPQSSPSSPLPDPNLYAPSSVSDLKISQQIERQERERHEAKMNTLMELFSSSSSRDGQQEGEERESGGESGEGGIEREVVEMVLWAEGGDVGRAVERLLEMV
ncbi:hypothetical protein JCM5350_000886 [Sporobolomyces pararoseus]